MDKPWLSQYPPGIPAEIDIHAGEAVKTMVVRKDPALTQAEWLAHCKLHLTSFKLSCFVEFRREALPKTNIGKILRRELRAPTTVPAEAPPATPS